MKNILWWLVPVALTAAALYWFYQHEHQPSADLPPALPAQLPPPPPAAPPAPTHYPVPNVADAGDQAAAGAKDIPSLEESDSALRAALTGLVGQTAFDNLFAPKEIVKRLVVTVDNLPRGKVSQNQLPVKKAPGKFLVKTDGTTLTIDPANSARYRPYIEVLDTADPHKIAAVYARFYPLFQQAYKELGYPDAYFNDRVIAALDDLLAAPEPSAPVQLLEPHLMYQFADPAMEALSAGQKTMIRMGPANEAHVKVKLRELRAELSKGAVAGKP